jgi:DUF4097 and DUF4098 domain-containing protein YvlB
MRVLMLRKNFFAMCLMLGALGIIGSSVTGQVNSRELQAGSAAARPVDRTAAAVEQGKSVNIKVERGLRIAVSNRAGGITIKGWDRDTVEATATSERGAETVQAAMTSETSGGRLSLSTNIPENRPPVSSLSSDLKINLPVQLGGRRRMSGREVHLEVKLPRYVEIESINIDTGDIEVTDMDGPIVNVRSNDGDIRVQDVKGFVNAVTRNGNITIRNVGGDVRSFALLGKINIQCVGGQVEVSNTRGAITLADVGGDVDVNTTGGSIELVGSLKTNHSYRLKSVMSRVLMSAEVETGEGFNATLSSYRGKVETDFPLTLQSSPESVRRIVGRYGAGQAQITLDSFHGDVSLVKAAPGTAKDCDKR